MVDHARELIVREQTVNACNEIFCSRTDRGGYGLNERHRQQAIEQVDENKANKNI